MRKDEERWGKEGNTVTVLPWLRRKPLGRQHKHNLESQDPISKAGSVSATSADRGWVNSVQAWEAPLPPSERIGDCDQFNHENLDSKVN